MSELNPEMLAKLRRLLDAATARPWMVDVEGDEVVVIVDEGDEFSFTQIAADLHQGDDGHTDACLIVAAVNALPDLLAAAANGTRLAARVDEVRALAEGATYHGNPDDVGVYQLIRSQFATEVLSVLDASLGAEDHK